MAYTLRESEYRLLELVWKNEPVMSPKLSDIALDALGWKKTTTYTVLRALVDKGYCQNINALVSSLVNKDEVQREDSSRIAKYVKEHFDGSLPKFITSFADTNELSMEEAEQMIKALEDFTNK